MVFEKIAAEFLWRVRPVDFTKIGRWWHKGEEIDLVALNDASKEVLFIECKWKTLSLAESMRNSVIYIIVPRTRVRLYFLQPVQCPLTGYAAFHKCSASPGSILHRIA